MTASAQSSARPGSAAADGPDQGDTLAKAARENFPVAPGFLPAAWRDDLMAVYGYARLVDDAGDGDLADPAGTAALLGAPAHGGDETAFRLGLLDALEGDLDRAFEAALPRTAGGTAGEPPRHPLIAALIPLIGRRAVTPSRSAG